MNNVFAKTDTTSVRADDDAKLRSHEQHTKNLRYASQTTGVNLADVNGFGLKQLLEDHSVVGVLSGGDTDAVRFQRFADSSVAKDVIRSGWLLDEPRLDLLKALHVVNSLLDVPDLVGVDHQHRPSGASVLALQVTASGIPTRGVLAQVLRVVDYGTNKLASTKIVRLISTDLHLEVVEALGNRLLGEARDLVVTISQPASRGNVGGVSEFADLGLALFLAGLLGLQEFEGFLFGDGV
jgi:hypothetical protein